MTTPDPKPSVEAGPKTDLLTIAAIGLFVSVLADVMHEGLGHGGACLLMGGHPTRMTSMNFEGDIQGLPSWSFRVVAAGGTIVNLVAGAIGLAMLRRPPASARAHYFWWLFAAMNLFVGTGYFLFSGASGIGDWANVVRGWPGQWGWRIGLMILGGVSYFLCMWLMVAKLAPLAGGELATRARRARKLTLIPYLLGAALSLAAGLTDPADRGLLLISAVAAPAGGMCGLVWLPFMMAADWVPISSEPRPITRSWGWVAAGVAAAALFVAVIGPGIRFR